MHLHLTPEMQRLCSCATMAESKGSDPRSPRAPSPGGLTRTREKGDGVGGWCETCTKSGGTWLEGDKTGTDASDYPQDDQRDRQTLRSGPRHQSTCLFSYRHSLLNKRKERTHGSGKIGTHSFFPVSDSDLSSSSTSLTAAGIDKRRYNWRTSISMSRLFRKKLCPVPY